MSEELAVPKGTNLSRRQLRKFLDENGPATVDALVAVASLSADGVTVERMQSELAAHPALFRQQRDGRWVAAPEKEQVVVRRSSAHPPKRRQRPTRKARAERRKPPSDSLVIEDGELTAITLPAQATEIAGDLIATVDLPLGQVGELVSAARAAVESGRAVEVFQPGADGLVAFRGSRQIVSARSSVDGVLRLIAGPADDDESVARALPSAQAPQLQAAAGGELVPYRAESIVLSLPPAPTAVAAAVEQLPARHAAAPSVSKGLGDVLTRIRTGHAGVDELDDWLSNNLARLDLDQRQRAGVRVARAKGLGAQDRLSRVRELVDPTVLADDLCRPLLLEVGASFEESSDLARWACPAVERVVENGVDDARLLLRCARVAWQADAYGVVVRLGRRLVEEQVELTSDDVTLIAQAAESEGDVALVEQLWTATVEQLGNTKPTKMPGERVKALVDLEAQLVKLGAHDPERRAMVIDLYLARNQPDAAMPLAERTMIDDASFRFEDRLAMLSLFEQCERRDDLRRAAALLTELIDMESGQVRPQLIAQSVNQLRQVEQLGGFVGDYSEPLELRIAPASESPISEFAQVEESSPDLSSTVIVIAGGQKAGRRRIRERLMEAGATVKEIQSPWEGRLSTGQIRSLCQHADLVVEMTREMKHETSYALDTVPDLGGRRKRVWGGPSAVVKEIFEWSRDRGAA